MDGAHERARSLGRLGNRLVSRRSLNPVASTMEVAKVGFLGIRLFARDRIVLSGSSSRGPLQIAIFPGGRSTRGDDMRKTWQALAEVGVRASSPAPEQHRGAPPEEPRAVQLLAAPGRLTPDRAVSEGVGPR